jgi:hypothetical protein
LIADFESAPDGGSDFAKVWHCFGWAHSPNVAQGEDATKRDLPGECGRVLSLVAKLPEIAVRQAIDGISDWPYNWRNQIRVLPEGRSSWLRLWPAAVETTNARQSTEEEIKLNPAGVSSVDVDANKMETLITPAGKLAGVFLAGCPPHQGTERPFDVDVGLRTMRDAISKTPGRAGTIARYCLIERLEYFLRADANWTSEHLITPLDGDNEQALVLWHAIA